MMESFKFEAFISYRHIEPDMTIAKKLHTYLETYRIPNSIRKQKKKARIGRVFRDQEELPLDVNLSENIRQALTDSKWLIVICSPRLIESKWCMKEIDTFISLGRRGRILAVLVSGSPEESFPIQLRLLETNGQAEEVEPLAANVVAGSTGEAIKKLRKEKLRILAPILGVDYDDLRRRERSRRLKAIMSIGLVSLVLLGSFAIYAAVQEERIKAQAVIADQQRVIAEYKQAEALNNKKMMLLEESWSATSAGDKLGGLVYALSAYELSSAIKQDNDDALMNAFERAAYIGSFDCISTIKSNSYNLSGFVTSPDKSMMLGITKDNSAIMLDADTGETLYTVKGDKGYLDQLNTVMFTPDGKYFLTAYYGYNSISIWETGSGALTAGYILEDTAEEKHNSYDLSYACFMPDSRSLLIKEENRIAVWDFLTGEKRFYLEGKLKESHGINGQAALSPDGSLVAVSNKPALLSLRDGSVLYLDPMEDRQYSNFCFSPDGMYVAASSYRLLAVWNAVTGKQLLSVDIDDVENIGDIAFCPNSSIIGLSSNKGFALFDMSSQSVVLSDQDGSPCSIEFDPNGDYFAANYRLNPIYDMHTLKKIEALEDLQITFASFCANDKAVLVFTGKGFNMLSLPAASMIKTAAAYSGELFEQIRWSPIKKWSSINSNHGFSSVSDGRIFYERGYDDPTGRYFAQTYVDGMIDIWEPAVSADQAYMLFEHNDVVTDLTFYGTLVASSDFYGDVVMFDLSSGKILYTFPSGGKVTHIEFSPDGSKLIILNAQENKAQVLSARSGNLLITLPGSDHEISKVGFTADGSNAVAVFTDGGAVYCEVFNGLHALVKHAKSLLGEQDGIEIVLALK